VADEADAALAEIRERNESRTRAMMYGDPELWRAAEGDVRRLLKVAETALKFHQRVPLYGNAATEDEPDACPHHPDSPLHFEDGDGSGEWLCEGKPEGAVCSSCVDGEGGERLEWPCPEYEAILAALAGKETGDGN
jgi:hypothetical protein